MKPFVMEQLELSQLLKRNETIMIKTSKTDTGECAIYSFVCMECLAEGNACSKVKEITQYIRRKYNVNVSIS